MSVMSAAASHILGNQTGGPGAGVPASRRARSPQLTAEEFFAQNQAHLRQRNSELAQMAARRRPQCRADDAAAGPVPEYILAKRGTLGRGGHYHERTRGVKPLPRGALGGSAAVVDRTRSGPCTDRAEAADSFAGGSPVNGSPRGRLNERTRLMPYAPHYSAYGEHEDEEGQKIAVGQTQAQKQKKLLARGWRLVQGGSGPVQRWVSPFRPMKTVIGLDAAYDAAASMPPHAGGIGQGNTTATQIIQVKQKFGMRKGSEAAPHRRPETSPLPTPVEGKIRASPMVDMGGDLGVSSQINWETEAETAGRVETSGGGRGEIRVSRGEGMRWSAASPSSRISVAPKESWTSINYGSERGFAQALEDGGVARSFEGDARSSGASPANGPEPVQVSPGGEGRGGPFAAPEKQGSIKVNPALLHLLQ